MANLSINGRSYDALDVKILMLGNEPREVSALSYGYTRDHANNPALGSDEPVSYSMGPKKYDDGSLTMSMKEVVAIENAAGGSKDITRIKPFITLITYLNDSNQIVTDKVIWKFKSWGRSVNIEELGVGKEFTMHTISIEPNIL